MSRHKRVPEQAQDQVQDPAGLGLWPFIWIIAIVVTIPLIVMVDPARGDQPVATYATSSTAGDAGNPGLGLGRQDQEASAALRLEPRRHQKERDANESPRETTSALSRQQHDVTNSQ